MSDAVFGQPARGPIADQRIGGTADGYSDDGVIGQALLGAAVPSQLVLNVGG